MRQDQPVLNDRNRQRAQQRANNGTEAAKQAGTAKHYGRYDLQLKALALVGGAAAESGGNDHPRQCGSHSADDIDLHGDRFGVNAAASCTFGVGADSGHVAAKAHMVEYDMPGNQTQNADQRGHGDTHYPRASYKGKQAVSRNRNRVALGDQKRDAANHGQGGESDDKRRNAFIGNKKAVDGANESAKQKAAEHYHWPRQPPVIKGDRGKRADQRQGRAHRQIYTACGNDQGHCRRDYQQRGTLTDNVQPVGAGEKVAGYQRKHHAAEDEKECNADHA
ncbi:hypothetical protein BBAD15_g911 [Beauveria bassiana D1-5]|uniref:Uncharacterized protein n=1 Tax=Beauveria bassiana D1-5 TaxID=1245745 RepID=A0A0A2W4K7_BEABA|nr:hypothetical protein BBAD15_g911 [Beauveria bassiana D1-5]